MESRGGPLDTHHFILVEKRKLPDYQAMAYFFEHDRTGMQVCFVENDDKEQFFSFIVRTIPTDSTGVAHILEHSTLSGSVKYPVHDPFMTLDKSSVNTYMNAMTYPDKTVYLAASPLAKDFDNILSVDLDSVFKPLLRRETFEQEGVRLVDDAKGGHWEGVVFNEMLGASCDHDGILDHGVIKALFPDSPYAFDAGGDPLSIVNLDWEQYKEFYRTHYHPSNVRLLVYGDNDMEGILEKLDREYLCDFGKAVPIPPPSLSPSFVPDGRMVIQSPKAEDGRDDGLSVVLSWLTTSSADQLEIVTLNTLVDLLLDDPTCPLYRLLLESGLAEDISPESGMIADFPRMVFIVGFKGIKEGMEDRVEKVILDSLGKIVEEGIEKEAIESSLKCSRFKEKEISGSYPQGLRIMGRAVHGWMQDKGPFSTMTVNHALDQLDACIKDDPRYFEHWIEMNLLDNHHRVLVSVVPNASYLEEQKRILQEKATAALWQGTKVDNARFDLFENTPDSDAALKSVPSLSLQDIPGDLRKNLYQKTMMAGCPVYVRQQFTNGITYLNVAIDVNDFTTEEMRCLTLYTRLLMTTGVGDMGEREVAIKMKELFGGFAVTTDNGAGIEDGKPRLFFCVQMKMLTEDVHEALLFASAFLQHANMKDPKRLKVALSDLKGDFADSVSYNANSFASLYASSLFSPSLQDSEVLTGTTQWLYLASLGDGNLDSLATMMDGIQQKLCERSRFFLCCCAEDSSYGTELESFLESFPSLQSVPAARERKALYESGNYFSVSFALPSNVAYCTSVCAIDTPPMGVIASAELLVAQMLTTGELWNTVRMKGGAYGVDARGDLQERIFTLSSYRDPRIEGTYDDFSKALEKYAGGQFRDEEIEQAKLSYLGMELKPLSPSRESIWTFRRLLYGYGDEIRKLRRDWLLACGRDEVVQASRNLLALMEKKRVDVVFASKKMLEEAHFKGEIRSLPL